jgi:hypothetical protein
MSLATCDLRLIIEGGRKNKAREGRVRHHLTSNTSTSFLFEFVYQPNTSMTQANNVVCVLQERGEEHQVVGANNK